MYILKKARLQIYNLIFHLKKPEKEEQIKSKAGKMKEIM